MTSNSATTSTDSLASFSNIFASTATPLTTYTSYITTTFVSGGTTYKQSQGVPVIVSNSAELASLSAAGAFQSAASSSTAPTGSQTVTGMYPWQEMSFRPEKSGSNSSS
jgi:hypothetical protein